jgi:hypothetical protein
MTCLHLLRTRLRPLALAVGLGWAFTSAGCYSWRAAPAAAGVGVEPRNDLRLTLLDSRRIYLMNARPVGDSLVGTTLNSGGAPIRISVAVAQVRAVEVHQFSVGKTVGLIVGLGVGLLAAAGAGWSEPGQH